MSDKIQDLLKQLLSLSDEELNTLVIEFARLQAEVNNK